MSKKFNEVQSVEKFSGGTQFERKVALDRESNLSKKICKLSMSKSARDYNSEEYQTLYECFLELGDIYVIKKAHIKASALYNMSHRIAVEKLKSSHRVFTNLE